MIKFDTNFKRIGKLEGGIIREMFPGAHIKIELGDGKSYINSDGTLCYACFPIEHIKGHVHKNTRTKRERDWQEVIGEFSKYHEMMNANQYIQGKKLYFLLSNTKDNRSILTIPTHRSENIIYDGLEKMYVVGDYTPPSQGPLLGEEIFSLYKLEKRFPKIEPLIYFHSEVADHQKIISSPEILETRISEIILKTNKAYELIRNELKK